MTSTDDSPTPRFLTFSQKTSTELNVVSIDHCYAKPWSSHPDASNARPLHMLFMEKFPRPGNQEKQRSPEIIDVEGDDGSTPPMYDVTKARAMMSDCERHAAMLRPDYSDSKDEWEDHIASVRTTWSVLQNRIFAKVMRVLQGDRLARLSIQGSKNEPIQRRLQIDKAAKRVRFSFANIGWEMSLILWLHNLFLENLRGQLLTSYLEVLQTLKAKIPSLIDRLIQGTTVKQGVLATESLATLLKRNWDPVLSSINQQKLKKLPDNPLLLIISNAPSSAPNPVAIKRHKFWQHQLASMGKVINVVPINNSTNMTIANCVENMIATTRSKILEMKGHFPGRPIVLIGWHVGALIATHVALMEVVHGVVCLGFPTMGVCGNRGDIDDQIYNCKTPTLFVIGQHASSSSLDTLEDIREKLRVETGLLLVGGADDQLRMSRAKKRSCGVTQAMVDRCIMDEMFEFLGNILSQVVVQPEIIEEVEITKKQRKRKQKDTTSAAGSQTVGNVPRQPSVKTVRAMKLANAGTVAFSGSLSVNGGNKLPKRPSPKKRAPKVRESPTASKHPMLHLSFPMISTSGDQTPASLSGVSEAAAIASAPELSNLLQSIKTSSDDQQKLVANLSSSLTSKTAVTSPSASSIATTTALTLSRFLASSGFFRTGALLKTGDPSSTETGLLLASTVSHTSPGSASPLAFGIASPSIQSPLTSTSVSTQSASTGTVSHTLGASVINIGSDSVFMKETPSSTTAPGTVSIDLGQIASGNSSSAMKFSTTPKISLIPAVKQIPISGSTERLLLTAPLAESQPSIATLSSLSQSKQFLPLKPHSNSTSAGASHLKSLQLVSTESGKTPSTPSLLRTGPPGMSSSQLLSTLSSNAGVITFKLAAPGVTTGVSSSDPVPAKDEPGALAKGTDLVAGQTRGGMNLQLHNLAPASSLKSANTGTLLSSVPKQSSDSQQQIMGATSSKPTSSPTSLIISPGSKLAQAQIVLQCRTPSTPTSHTTLSKPTSPKLVSGTATETLGQVASLLESSPITLGDLQSHVTQSSETSLTKTSNKGNVSSLPSPSSSPLSSQSTTGSAKSSKTTISSYTATPKSVLSTTSSTRTRKIKTPKQYDL